MSELSKTSLVAKARRTAEQYSSGEDRPLGGYLAGIAVYSSLTTGLGLLARAQRRPLPSPTPFEVLLLAAATHKLTRLITKESITSAIRAPFTEYKGVAGPAELHEEVRGEGVRHAVGELVTCPFCLAQWTATGFTYGLIFAPRATRLVALALATVAGSDWLQLGYAWAQHKAMG